MNIREILKGTTPGKIQQVGYMSIIPVLREPEDVNENVCDPTKILIGTRNYGEMDMENPTDKIGIVPFGTGVLTKQRAQNHATPKAKILRSKALESIDYGACIQETQGGLISRGEHEFTILPWSLREAGILTRNKKEYSKLWAPIREFNNSLGVRITGHLEVYLDHFKDDLDSFVAQFEVVPNQVGAIILMNGYVMGIELTPNYSYFRSIWKPLIRESYGSLVLQYQKQFGEDAPIPRTRVALQTNVKDMKSLQKELVRTQEAEDEKVKDVIRKFVNDKFTCTSEEIADGYKVQTVTNKQFIGQVVTKDSDVQYASLVTSARGIREQQKFEKDDFVI